MSSRRQEGGALFLPRSYKRRNTRKVRRHLVAAVSLEGSWRKDTGLLSGAQLSSSLPPPLGSLRVSTLSLGCSSKSLSELCSSTSILGSSLEFRSRSESGECCQQKAPWWPQNNRVERSSGGEGYGRQHVPSSGEATRRLVTRSGPSLKKLHVGTQQERLTSSQNTVFSNAPFKPCRKG